MCYVFSLFGLFLLRQGTDFAFSNSFGHRLSIKTRPMPEKTKEVKTNGAFLKFLTDK